MSYIWAEKKGLRKKFLQKNWDLLKDKNGWVKIESNDSVAENTIKKAPDSGERKVVEVVDSVVKNNDKVANNVENKGDVKETVVFNKVSVDTEFANFVKENLSKSNIKDFFDSPEGKTPYKNSMNFEALTELLNEKFKGSLEDLKTAFKMNNSPEESNDSGLNTGGL